MLRRRGCWTSPATTSRRVPEIPGILPLRERLLQGGLTSCPAPCRGRLRNWRTPEQSTLAAPGRSWRARKTRSAPAGTRNAPTCWWPSLPGSTAGRAPAGAPHPLDLLPRPGRFNEGHGGSRHRPAGTVCPRFQGPGGETQRRDRGGAGQYNRNYIGGDFSAGTMDLRGLVQRPVVSPRPWRTPVPRRLPLFLLHPARPRGHGHAGLHAATHALKDIFGLPVPALGLRWPVEAVPFGPGTGHPALAHFAGDNSAVGKSTKLSVAVAALILGTSLVACDDGRGGAEAAAQQFATAVSGLDVAVSPLTARTPPPPRQQLQGIFKALDPQKPAVEAGDLTLDGDNASAPLNYTWKFG